MKKHTNDVPEEDVMLKQDQHDNTVDEQVVERVADESMIWKNKYLRALADYENLERRTENQTADINKRANKKILLKLIDILDVINQAEVFVKDPGLKLVKDEFQKLLASEGVKQMDLVGKEYDPYTAEVIEMVAGKKPNMVAEVVRNGYTLHDEVLRHAQVKVSS